MFNGNSTIGFLIGKNTEYVHRQFGRLFSNNSYLNSTISFLDSNIKQFFVISSKTKILLNLLYQPINSISSMNPNRYLNNLRIRINRQTMTILLRRINFNSTTELSICIIYNTFSRLKCRIRKTFKNNSFFLIFLRIFTNVISEVKRINIHSTLIHKSTVLSRNCRHNYKRLRSTSSRQSSTISSTNAELTVR